LSESDSFIDEVTDEVRRDKLFKLFKKYTWILVLVVVAIVGGTAYNEWNKSRQETEARLTGDLLLAAIAAQDSEALANMAAGDTPSALIAQLQQANILESNGDIEGAVAALGKVAGLAGAAPIYTDLAWLKIIMLDGANMDANARNDAYDRLTAPGGPYRLLAQEQRAMQYVRDGDNDAAVKELAAILDDPEVTPGLRSRAQQLIVALGGDLDADTANG